MNPARYSLSGMHGTWSEYWVWSNDPVELRIEAVKRLKFGYNAILEDWETGEVTELLLKGEQTK